MTGLMTCDYCRKEKPDACLRPDPIAADVWADNSLVFMCDDCERASAEDL